MTNKTEADEAISDEQIHKMFLEYVEYPLNVFFRHKVLRFARALLALTQPAAPSVTAEVVARDERQAIAENVAVIAANPEGAHKAMRIMAEDIRDLKAQLAQRVRTGEDAKDAARYRWLVKNCFDWSAAGDGDIFDHISLHFESDLLSQDHKSVDRAIDSAMEVKS